MYEYLVYNKSLWINIIPKKYQRYNIREFGMFGYIYPEKPELKIKEYELFRAYYCGICKSIANRYGQLPRLTLNYDSTFLAIILSSLSERKNDIRMERCIAHPVKKRSVIRNSDIIDYASDINIILAYYKLRDDWKDEKSIKSGAAALFLEGIFKKIRKKYARKCEIISHRLRELDELEKERCNSMDRAAEPFARLMEEIMYYPDACTDEKHVSILKWMGYNIGKWIYIIDAYNDLEDDIRKKTYNPFIYQYNYTGSDVCSFKDEIRDKVEFNLVYTLNQLAKSYELLEVKDNKGILENIIYMGMLRKTEQILDARSCKKVEKPV